MKKPIKYSLVAVAFLGILVIGAILAITTFIDVEGYKPKIENFVTEKTGYPLHLGGKISLSFFPWIGLSFSDLQLDNPDGFTQKGFIRIESFQARLKVMPLFSRKVEISKFVVNRPELNIEKSPEGLWNWQKLTEIKTASSTTAADKVDQKKSGDENQGQGGFALQSLDVGEFAITDGSIALNDLQKKQKHQISAFDLQLTDVSFDKPIKMTLSSHLDDKPFSLKGSVGPLGTDPGAGVVNLNVALKVLKTLSLTASGSLKDLKGQMSYDMKLRVEPFSPKELISSLGMAFPVETADPGALGKLGAMAAIAGNSKQLVVSDGKIVLDDTVIELAVTAKNFSRPDLVVDVAIDSIDLDRYLPPAARKEKAASGQEKTENTEKEVQKTSNQPGATAAIDYDPLRKLQLKAVVKLGQLKVHGGTIHSFLLNITGKNGLFSLNSLAMDLYEGSFASTGKVNVQKKVPETNLDFTLQNVQVGPLVKDFTQKELIEGKLKAKIAIRMKGDTGVHIKESLSGEGNLLFLDGALIGVDLAQMARNIKSGFTLEQQGEKPKTDFAELQAPFTINNGLVNTSETILRSPFIRVVATGDADLVSERLKMKVKPTIVGTMKGQGDAENRTGLTVPVLVEGTFQSPKFSPDLEALVKDRLPSEKDLGELIKTGKVPSESKEQLNKEVEQVKGMFKGLLGK